MSFRVSKHLFIRLSAAALVTLASGVATASGTDGASSSETGDAAAYNMGKSVYAAKLACSKCPMAGKSLDAALAKQLLASKPGVAMSAEEERALNAYLKRRFKL
jgi:hypothetical protein